MKQIETIDGKRYLILGFEIFNFNRREETYSDIVRNARGIKLNAAYLTTVDKIIAYILYSSQQFIVAEINTEKAATVIHMWYAMGMEIKDFVPNTKEQLWLMKSRLQNEELNAFLSQTFQYNDKQLELKEKYLDLFEFMLSMMQGTLLLESKPSKELKKYHLYLYRNYPNEEYKGFIYAGKWYGLVLGEMTNHNLDLDRILFILMQSKPDVLPDAILNTMHLDTMHKLEFTKYVG